MRESKLGEIASVSTLVLFVIYFVGRCITIFTIGRLLKDRFITDPKMDDYKEFGVVDDIYLEESEEDKDMVYGLMVSKEGMRNIKVYSVKDDENGIPCKKDKEIFYRDFLNINEALGIHVMSGDLFPTLIIEYETIDYMKVKIEWRDNLKSGFFLEGIKPRHTVKSFIYFMCR